MIKLALTNMCRCSIDTSVLTDCCCTSGHLFLSPRLVRMQPLRSAFSPLREWLKGPLTQSKWLKEGISASVSISRTAGLPFVIDGGCAIVADSLIRGTHYEE